jgi:hypothetical protein
VVGRPWGITFYFIILLGVKKKKIIMIFLENAILTGGIAILYLFERNENSYSQ